MKTMRTVPAFVTSLLCVAGLSIAPPTSEAGPLTSLDFDFGCCNYGNLEFGPALGFARIVDQEAVSSLLYVDNNSLEMPTAIINLTSGHLVHVEEELGPFGDATYTHAGGGNVSIAFDLVLPGGVNHHGTFSAKLKSYVIAAVEEGGTGDSEGHLGAGLFDIGTAHLLGISPHTPSGDVYLLVDSFDDYPAPYRVGRSFGSIFVDARPVPEPAPLWLMALAMSVGGLRFYRRAAARADA